MIAALLYALSARPLLCVVIRNINFISGHRRLQSGEEREILFLHFALRRLPLGKHLFSKANFKFSQSSISAD
jgi:hypothetical protein